jgi:hypothetical protein
MSRSVIPRIRPRRRIAVLASAWAKEGVLLHFSWKRWRLALTAALAAIAVSVAFASPAFAAEPGESSSWSLETVNNHNMQVAAQDTLSEARNSGNLLEVWRGATNNQVWLSFNNGNAYTLGTTATYVSPTVVPWGPDSFVVFHTGTDGNIYYTTVYNDGSWDNRWYSVPWQTTNMPVSVAQIGAGSYDLYMVYRGSGSDQRVWGTSFTNAGWGNAVNIAGGSSPSAPSVTWNDHVARPYVMARGEDNQVWMTTALSGTDAAPNWYGWSPTGGYTIDTPHMSAVSNGYMLADYLDGNFHVQTRVYDPYGNAITDWQPESTGWQTYYPAQLAAYGAALIMLLTGLNGLVYYKQAYYNNN